MSKQLASRVAVLATVGFMAIGSLSVFAKSWGDDIKKDATAEIGSAVVRDIKYLLKSPFFDLLSSSELILWSELKNRIDAVKNALGTFETKHANNLKDEASASVAHESPKTDFSFPPKIRSAEPAHVDAAAPKISAMGGEAATPAPVEALHVEPVSADIHATEPAHVAAPVAEPVAAPALPAMGSEPAVAPVVATVAPVAPAAHVEQAPAAPATSLPVVAAPEQPVMGSEPSSAMTPATTEPVVPAPAAPAM